MYQILILSYLIHYTFCQCQQFNIEDINQTYPTSYQSFDDQKRLRPIPNPIFNKSLQLNDRNQYLESFINLQMIPFIIIMGIIISMIFVFFSQIILRSVCKIRLCSRDLRLRPYNSSSIFSIDMISFSCAAMICITCSIIIALFSHHQDYYNETNCALVSPWEYYISGSTQSSQWAGLNLLENQILSYTNQIQSQQSNIQDLSNNFLNFQIQTSQYMDLVIEMQNDLQNTTVNDPNPTNPNGILYPNVIVALPNISNPSSICGSLSINYQTLVINYVTNLSLIGTLANQALNLAPQTALWNQNFANNKAQAQSFLNIYTQVAGNNFQNLNSIIEISTYSVYSFFFVLSVVDVLFYLWVRFYLIDFMHSQRQRQFNDGDTHLIHQGPTITKINNIIYLLFWIEMLVIVCCCGIFAITAYSFLVSLDYCIISNQQNLKTQCSGNFTDSTNSLGQNIGIQSYLQIMGEIDYIASQLNQQNSILILLILFQDYPPIIKQWLSVLKSTYDDPSVPPNLVNSFNNISIQLGCSTNESFNILYDLNTWSDYSAPLERQYSVTNCMVLQDQIVYSTVNCQKNKNLINISTSQIGGNVCMIIQNPIFAIERLNATNLDSCLCNLYSFIQLFIEEMNNRTYPNLTQNYYKRYDSLYNYQQQLQDQIIKPMSNYLNSLQQLQDLYTDQIDSSVSKMNSFINQQFLDTSIQLNQSLTCQQVDLIIQKYENYLCTTNLNSYYTLFICTFLNCIFGFFFITAAYFRTSQKTFQLELDDSDFENNIELHDIKLKQ